MTAGRCPGCGKTDSSCKIITNHMTGCPDLAKMYQSGTDILTAEQEYERWKREEDNPDVRAAAKDVRLTKRFAEMDAKREAQSQRWTAPDILGD